MISPDTRQSIHPNASDFLGASELDTGGIPFDSWYCDMGGGMLMMSLGALRRVSMYAAALRLVEAEAGAGAGGSLSGVELMCVKVGSRWYWKDVAAV